MAGILHGEPEAPKRTIATISQVNHQATMDRVGTSTRIIIWQCLCGAYIDTDACKHWVNHFLRVWATTRESFR